MRCILVLCVLVLFEVPGGAGDRESECTEVGFARSVGAILYDGYEAAKSMVLERWADEDKKKKPLYEGLTDTLKNVTRTAQILEETSLVILGLIRKTRVGKRCNKEWLLRGMEKHVLPLINLDKELAEELGLVMSFRCLVGAPYPNVDGTCVNQDSPDLGSIGSKFLRLQPPRPGLDGFSLRSSVNLEKTLPSSRLVASFLRDHMPELELTELFREWGHFIQRDTVSIPTSPLAEDTNCCQSPEGDDCAPIFLEKNDPDHSKLPCINFKRSIRAQAIIGHRESLSIVSTFLDATPLYGATNEEAFELKTGYFGYLKAPEEIPHVAKTTPTKKKKEEKSKEKQSSKKEKKQSVDKEPKAKCTAPLSFKDCFQVDEKSNYVEGLRLLLALEHNRIADKLAEINPHFDDALLYNEARRLLIAEYNAVTYGEYLPVLLGKEVVKKHSLQLGAEGPAAQYIPEINPGVLSSFALAAYRNPLMFSEWRSEWGKTDVLDSVHYTSVRADSYKDILAMDIQRARDHGIPSYQSWRRFCSPEMRLDSWDDLESIFSKDVVKGWKSLYNDELSDIDIQAALLERHEEGASVGKTFSCILADQFARLKTGNRLYWEHDSSMFTEEQKKEIRESVSASRLICLNLPVSEVPTNAFLPVSETNPLVKCSDISPPDLSFWKDTSLIEKMKQVKGEQRQEEEETKQEREAVTEGERIRDSEL